MSLFIYIICHLAKTHLARDADNQPDLSKRLPQAIIIGTRKSGTRALLRFLEINPAVRAAKREIHFFDNSHNYKLGLDWYRDQMPVSRPGQLTVEKSPSYFVTRHVAERIKSMNSSVRLIVIFRDPVTRLISDFSQLVDNKIQPADADYADSKENADYYKDDAISWSQDSPTLERESAWVDAEKHLAEYIIRSDGGINDQRRAIQIGMYSNYLEKWLSLFGKNQIHYVDGERLILDPQSEMSKLEKFLGLRPYIRRRHFAFDSNKGFFCINGTAIQGDNSAEFELTTGSTNAKPGIHCLSKSKGRRHVKLKKELLDKLLEFYEPHNEYLQALTGISFLKEDKSS